MSRPGRALAALVFAVWGLLVAGGAGCSLLLDTDANPYMCNTDQDCARYPNAACDNVRRQCVPRLPVGRCGRRRSAARRAGRSDVRARVRQQQAGGARRAGRGIASAAGGPVRRAAVARSRRWLAWAVVSLRAALARTAVAADCAHAAEPRLRDRLDRRETAARRDRQADGRAEPAGDGGLPRSGLVHRRRRDPVRDAGGRLRKRRAQLLGQQRASSSSATSSRQASSRTSGSPTCSRPPASSFRAASRRRWRTSSARCRR